MEKVKDSGKFTSLSQYLAYTGVDDIPDDELFCEAEHDEIIDYLYSHSFNVSDDDIATMESRGYCYEDLKELWDEDMEG